MENKITAIIVDDEPNGREVLRDLLENFFKEVEILGEADSVENAYKLIESKKPQLVFLDIQMPRQNGFTLLKKYNEVPFEVVFVTSYDEYAIKAIKFSALDYLLKPVEVNDLHHAISKSKKAIELKQKSNVQILNLLNNLDSDVKDRKIAVHVGKAVRLLNASQIIFIEAEGRYSNITILDGEQCTTAKFLKDFEEFFGSEGDFVRIHKSCIINIRYIKEYSKGEPCIVEMINGNTFEVARRKKQEILERLKK